MSQFSISSCARRPSPYAPNRARMYLAQVALVGLLRGRRQPPGVPKTEMTFLTWEQAVDLAEAHQERYRALIYLAGEPESTWADTRFGSPSR